MGRPDQLDADEDRKPVCPDCGSCTIARLTGRVSGGGGYWWCNGCSDRFPEAAYAVPARQVDDPPHISAAGRAAIEWEPEEEG